uniref:ABC transmembrane type-1 domain-containing protein n=1 Tax=Globodera pallida TaxID=36090 RepID=A0A183BYV4_GLOPA
MAVAHFINLVRNPTVPFLSVLLIVALGGSAIPLYNVLLIPPNNGMSAFMPEAFTTLHRQRTGQNEFFRTAAKKSSSLSASSSSAFPSQQSFAFQPQEALKNNRVARDIADDGTNEVGAAADAAKFAFAFAKRSAAQWDDGGRHGGVGQLPFAGSSQGSSVQLVEPLRGLSASPSRNFLLAGHFFYLKFGGTMTIGYVWALTVGRSRLGAGYVWALTFGRSRLGARDAVQIGEIIMVVIVRRIDRTIFLYKFQNPSINIAEFLGLRDRITAHCTQGEVGINTLLLSP